MEYFCVFVRLLICLIWCNILKNLFIVFIIVFGWSILVLLNGLRMWRGIVIFFLIFIIDGVINNDVFFIKFLLGLNSRLLYIFFLCVFCIKIGMFIFVLFGILDFFIYLRVIFVCIFCCMYGILWFWKCIIFLLSNILVFFLFRFCKMLILSNILFWMLVIINFFFKDKVLSCRLNIFFLWIWIEDLLVFCKFDFFLSLGLLVLVRFL